MSKVGVQEQECVFWSQSASPICPYGSARYCGVKLVNFATTLVSLQALFHGITMSV